MNSYEDLKPQLE
jgi:hypothetical protein